MVGKTKIAHYLAALILAFLFLFSLPHISFGKEIVFLLLPLPFIILSVLAPYPSLGINIFLGLVLSKSWGKYEALGFVLGVALFSWVVGWLMHYSFRASRVILIGIILAALGTGLFFLTAGGGYLSQMRENFDCSAIESMSYYKEHGMEEEKLVRVQETMDKLRRIIEISFPAIIIISAAALVNFNYFLARRLLIKLGYRTQPVPSLAQLKIPDKFIWVFIGAFCLIWAGQAARSMASPVASDAFSRIGLNFMILMLAAYLVQGLILVNFFLKKWNWPVFLRVFFYALLLLQPFFLGAVILWGISEVWFNFRRLEIKG